MCENKTESHSGRKRMEIQKGNQTTMGTGQRETKQAWGHDWGMG